MRFLAFALVVVIALAALVSLPRSNSEAAWPGANGKILFTPYPDGRIWVMDADGSNRDPITDGPFDYNGVWSPDGTMIVFQRNQSIPGAVGSVGGGFQIWTVEADGLNPQQIGPGADPSWSPDGTRILYVIDDEIHEMDAANGANDVTITQGEDDSEPIYRPDGSVIAFIRSGQIDTASIPAGITSTSEIFTVEPDGQNVQPASDNILQRKYAPDWAPDGSRLIYSAAESSDLWTMEYPSGATQLLLTTDDGSAVFDGVFSPDGTQVVFGVEVGCCSSVISPQGGDLDELWIMNADGSNPHLLPGEDPNQQEFSPDWQPVLSLPTPTPSPTPALTASPSPTLEAETGTATPTASPTSTATAAPTESAGPTPTTDDLVWGDAQCDDEANPIDSLVTLRYDAGLAVNTGECPPLGTEVEIVSVGTASDDGATETWGNVDCDAAISPVDSLKILRFDAGLSVAQEAGCPPIGADVTVQYGP